MKYTLLLGLLIMTGSFTQANQSFPLAQSALTMADYQQEPNAPKNKKMPTGGRPKMNSTDSTSPRNRKPQRLNPDSLRRGGATRVDTIRR